MVATNSGTVRGEGRCRIFFGEVTLETRAILKFGRPGRLFSSRPHGLTLRHFPQSFEYSTLGGWIATRGGGHFATLYTHIDDSLNRCALSRREA